jgi:hypothetical protein
MIRLHILTEGKTEQNFAKDILAPHLFHYDVIADAFCIQTSRDRLTGKKHSGGLASYGKAKNDILRCLADSSKEYRCTTMFDMYALPKRDFPGYADVMVKTDKYEQVRALEEKMTHDIKDRRFIPYIQLHEFEALLLADPQQLTGFYLGREASIQNLVAMVGDQNPELINDGPETAPSKRIKKELPEYKKAVAGPFVVGKIGLPTLRAKCKHFDEWISRLESLAGASHE